MTNMVRPLLLAVVTLLITSTIQVASPQTPNADRIAVLITDWVEPEGFDDHYRRTVVSRSFGARAELAVPADAHPTKPDSFTIKDHEAFNDPADNMVGAWDDCEGYIGTQRVPAAKADDQGKRLSEPVLLGPYRTLFNRHATVTLPVRSTRNSDPARLRAFIYSEVSENWEPLFPPAGSEGLRFDAAKRTVSFEIQVLGVFLVLETHPDWTPRSAVKNPPVRAAAA